MSSNASPRPRSAQAQRPFFVITGPSGAGKSTLVKLLLKAEPNLRFSVSHTTRPPREGEINGREYHFVSPEEFTRLRDEGAFLEWAKVHDHYYGSARNEEKLAGQEGRYLLLDIDPQGAMQVKKNLAGGLYIFIMPPSLKVLKQRLTARKTETPAALAQRLANAEKEMKYISRYDFLIVNDLLEEARADLLAIVRAEKCRAQRANFKLKNFLAEE